jgi:uroporphyrinogen-III synthase
MLLMRSSPECTHHTVTAVFSKLIVTRPQPEADRWVQGFARSGLNARALPLIDIAQLRSAELELARSQLPQFQAVMFVSPAAVRAFFAQHVQLSTITNTRFLATGPGTVRALKQAGVSPSWIDAPAVDSPHFDSEALWNTIAARGWAAEQVLIVRGQGETHGRDWLATQFQEAGALVKFVLAYVRRPPDWTEQDRKIASQATTDGSAWLFSSSEAVLNLMRLMPDHDWSQVPCICTHERIAQTTRSLGFQRIALCRPTLQDVTTFCHAQ